MKMLLVVLCMAAVSGRAMGSPVKRNSPIIIDLASPQEETGGNFEGDIILTPEQENAVKDGYTAVIGEKSRWPNNIVPYKIDTATFTAIQQNSIIAAFQQIELVSCIRFVPRTTEQDYVLVTGASSGCSAYLGRRGGMQTVNLQPNGCMSRGTIIHEFLHALGFVHTQSASERDLFIDINWSSITPDKRHNFDRRDSTMIDDYGIAYDYDSVMHYGPMAFSSNGESTIIPKQSGASIGQRVGLSYKDIKRLNLLYPNCYRNI